MDPPFEWELIIIDNGSTDSTPQIIAAFLATFSRRCRVLSVAEAGNGVGRNAGIAVAQGEIIAFTDDDCYVDETFLEEVAKLFGDKTLGYVSGRILLFDSTDYPITINKSLESFVIRGGSPIRSGLIQGANMAFRRRALEEVGLFDPDFGAGARFAGEDWELAMRVGAAGWSGGYFPQPIVWHHHGRKPRDAPKLFRFYSIGEGAVYARGILDPVLRRNVIHLWSRSVFLDIFKTQSVKHMAFVAWGAIRYWATASFRSWAAIARRL
jgi:glycosyltransferase involved in cell wall biosynthesis